MDYTYKMEHYQENFLKKSNIIISLTYFNLLVLVNLKYYYKH